MKPEDLSLLLQLKLWEERRTSLYAFMRYLMPELMPNWHFEVICARLERLRYETNQRIIIMLPPQIGKSLMVSRFLPAYILGHLPKNKIVLSSYAADLADSFNRDVQRIMDNEKYYELFDTRLNTRNIKTLAGQPKRTSNFFETVGHYGYLKTVGVGGSLTGSRSDLLIVDDPCKGREQADSKVVQKRTMEWYQSVAETRCSKFANRIIMHTPWSNRDLSFQMIANAATDPNAPAWEVLKFPAIAEGVLHKQDPREEGEVLFESFYGDLETMMQKKSTVGSREWASLYQCNPVPAGGTIIKTEWIQYYDAMPDEDEFDEIIQSWDLRFSRTSEANDYVVGQVWGSIGAEKYLLDHVRGRWSFTESLEQFKRLTEKWPTAHKKIVENKANGPALEDSLRKTIDGIVLREPRGNKEQRLYKCEPIFEAGNVLFPRSHAWKEEVIFELTAFPTAPHDDCVDTCTMALIELMRSESRSYAVVGL